MGLQGLKRRSTDVAFVAPDVAAVSADEAVHAASYAHAAPGLSLLRLSVPARLAIVAVVAAFLWAAVLWALS